MIRVATVLLVALLIVQSVVAQTPGPDRQPIRVRITGVDRYEIAGVITVETDRIGGRAVTLSPNMVRFSRADGERVISVLQPGRRITGEARAVEGDLLEFVGDDDQEVSFLLTDSIAVIERQKSRRSLENATGIGIGAAAGVFGLSYLGAMACQPDEHVEGPCWRFFQTLMFVGAPIVGALLGWYIGRVKWERITIDELRGEFATCGVRELYDRVRNSTAQSLRPLWAW